MTRTSARGFSIIEIVIAAALVAMLGLALFTLLKTGLRGKETLVTVSGRIHAGRLAIERMANEISMAYLSGHVNPTNPVVITNFEGQEHSIAFDAFGNIPFLKDAKESDQRELSFFIADDEKTRKPALMRKIHNNLTNDLGKDGRVEVLCQNVKSLTFKYWDDDLKLWQAVWTTDGVAARQTLPSRIQIELVILMSDDKERKFMTEVEIWLKKRFTISK